VAESRSKEGRGCADIKSSVIRALPRWLPDRDRGLIYGAVLVQMPAHWIVAGGARIGGSGDANGGQSHSPERFPTLSGISKLQFDPGFLTIRSSIGENMKMKWVCGLLLTATIALPAVAQVSLYIGSAPPPMRYERHGNAPGPGFALRSLSARLAIARRPLGS
jgi:hypothetical protein